MLNTDQTLLANVGRSLLVLLDERWSLANGGFLLFTKIMAFRAGMISAERDTLIHTLGRLGVP